MTKSKFQILNTLIIKIIAIITMSLDHIGVFLGLYFPNDSRMLILTTIFRIIGRISFPLIAMLFAEAMIHTSDQKNYLSRLALVGLLILSVNIGIYYGANIYLTNGNIFITLLSSGLFIYFLNKKNQYRFLVVIPLFIIIMSFINDLKFGEFFYPSYLKADYSLLGFLLCTGFYYAYKISDERVLSLTEHKKDINELRVYPYYRTFTNIVWAIMLFILITVFWLLTYIDANLDIYNMPIESYSLIAIIPLLLYNGKKGYNNKIVQYSFYVYYPLHLLIIFLGFYLSFGIY